MKRKVGNQKEQGRDEMRLMILCGEVMYEDTIMVFLEHYLAEEFVILEP
jgi:hypothetical protein